MGTFLIVLLQVVLAVVVAGLVAPAILFTVPATRQFGPATLAVIVGLVFVLLRIAWPRRRE